MIKIFSILFSFLFLVQSVNIHFDDLIKLKHLLEHANLHSEKYGDSFTVYFSKHFGDLKDSHKEQHQEEEKDLGHKPIHHDCSSQIQFDVLLNFNSFTFCDKKIIESKKGNFNYKDLFSTFEKQKIFQPPRV